MKRLLAQVASGIGIGFVLSAQLPSSGSAAAPTPVTGVWSFVSETNPETGAVRDEKELNAIWVFTNGYHCVARMQTGRQGRARDEVAKLPLEERVRHYEQMLRYVSNAGPYSVRGKTLSRDWQISLEPTMIGDKSVATFSVESDRLIVDLPRRSPGGGPGSRVVYRRLE